MATKASRIALAGSNISSTGEVDADLLDNIDSAAFLSLDSNSRLGIGTSSSIRTLDVRSGTTDVVANFESSDSGAFIALQDNTTSSDTAVMIGANGDDLRFDAGDIERMRIDSSGNVGIGTTSPANKLHVHSGISSDIVRFGNDNGSFILGKTGGLGSLDMASDANFRIRHGSTISAYFKNDGNVGIGTTNPTEKFMIVGDGARMTISSDDHEVAMLGRRGSTAPNWDRGYLRLKYDSANTVILDTDGVSYLNGGNVGIGTTSPSRQQYGSVDPKLHVNATGTSGSYDLVARFQAGPDVNNTGAAILINHGNDRGLLLEGGRELGDTGIAHFSILSSGAARERILTLKQGGNVGIGTINPSAKLQVEGTLTVRSSSSQVFNDSNNANNLTMDNSSATFNIDGADKDFRVECPGNEYAIFLDSGGQRLYFGNSSTSNNTSESVYVDVEPNNRHMFIAGNNREVLYVNRNGSAGTAQVFRANNVQVGGIGVTSSSTTYNTTSDLRLKENIVAITDATGKLMNMKPVTHTWIDNPEAPQVHGFIAQEMQEVVPEAVTGDAESDKMMSMDYGRITPVIVAALQDALKEIKELKIRIDELENK